MIIRQRTPAIITAFKMATTTQILTKRLLTKRILTRRILTTRPHRLRIILLLGVGAGASPPVEEQEEGQVVGVLVVGELVVQEEEELVEWEEEELVEWEEE